MDGPGLSRAVRDGDYVPTEDHVAKIDTGNKVTHTGQGMKPRIPKTGAKPPVLPGVKPGQDNDIKGGKKK